MRRELKYVLGGVDQRSVATFVLSRLPGLTQDHAARRVSSVYFDSHRYVAYSQSNAGMSQRTKLRLRWYGDSLADARPVIELKRRLEHVGSKRLEPIDSVDLQRMTWAAIRAEMATRLSGQELLEVQGLRLAILVATYRRHYFATIDRQIRVTVDTDLQFFDQRHRPKPNFVFDSVKAGFAVIECKIEESVDWRAARLLEPLGLRWTRFSKYCFGLTALSRLGARSDHE